MATYVWSGVTWTPVTRIKVWQAGSYWADCISGKIWNGSSWVEFYTAYAAQLFDNTYTRTGASPASFQVNSDGYIYGSVGATQLAGPDYQWRTGIGTSSDYQVYATYLGGSGSPGGSALNTWLTLSSSAQWNVTAAAGLYRYAILDVSIRMTAAPNTVLAGPTQITIECDRS